MLQTLVSKHPADNLGADISDGLLTTIESQISRGTSEIRANYSSRILRDCALVPSEFLRPTSTICVTDMERGDIYGIIDSFNLKISIAGARISITSSITYEAEV